MDVIRSRPAAKNARLLTWARLATFSLKIKLPTELFYPLQIEKNISFALKLLHPVEKKHCFSIIG
jgi:hypothetical protein